MRAQECCICTCAYLCRTVFEVALDHGRGGEAVMGARGGEQERFSQSRADVIEFLASARFGYRSHDVQCELMAAADWPIMAALMRTREHTPTVLSFTTTSGQ